MRAAVFHGPGDIRIEDVPDPKIEKPTDAIVRITHTAVCGSDLWFYRGQQDYQEGWRTGHEPMGVVEEVGSEVRHVKPGDLVMAPFAISDGTCEFCRRGLQTSCLHGDFWGSEMDGAQGEAVRAPFARPGGAIGYVGVPHGPAEEGLDVMGLFFGNLTLRGGPAPVRAYMNELMADVLDGTLDPSPVFDKTVDLDGVPEGYAAMDRRESVKVFVRI